MGLFRTADALKRGIGPVLEPAGITPQQYNVLRILRGASGEGLPTLEIAERMIEHAPGITRLVDRLERKGLVRRRRAARDRRQVRCFITPQGLALLAGLDEPVHKINLRSLEALDGEEIADLIATMDKIREGLRAPRGRRSPGSEPKTKEEKGT